MRKPLRKPNLQRMISRRRAARKKRDHARKLRIRPQQLSAADLGCSEYAGSHETRERVGNQVIQVRTQAQVGWIDLIQIQPAFGISLQLQAAIPHIAGLQSNIPRKRALNVEI